MFWRVRGGGIGRADAEPNRDRMQALAAEAPAPGLVALAADGTAVGWVGLGPRERFERLEHSRVRPRLDDTPIWSIVCFVIAKTHRRRGLERQLLDAAVAYARAHAAPAIEAFPVDPTMGRPSAATLYSGTLSTFLRAGFQVVRPMDSPTATVVRSIVRLALAAAPDQVTETPTTTPTT